MAAGERLDLEAVGARIEGLLDRIAADHGDAAAALAEDLVRDLVGLYGAGLARTLDLVSAAADGPGALRALGDDPLMAALLALHDLHPVPVAERVADAVGRLARTSGAQVDVVAASASDVTVLLDVRGCASTRAALRQAVEAAVRRAAPEVEQVHVDEVAGDPVALIPAESLWRRGSERVP